MEKKNILEDFFTKIAKAIKIKLSIDDKVTPLKLASKIEAISERNSGKFVEDIECFLSTGKKEVKSVIISEDVKVISSSSYENFVNLKQVIFLGKKVETIGEKAFSGCGLLEEINFPESLSHVGSNALSGTTWLKNQSGYVYTGNVLYTYKGTPDNGEIILEEGTSGLSNNCLYNNSLVSTITGYVSKIIGQNACRNCTNLTSIELHQKEGEAITIYNNAFDGCSSLTVAKFDNIKAINYGTFLNCPALTDVYFLNDDPSVLTEYSGIYPFQNKGEVTIHVKKGTLEQWRIKLQDTIEPRKYNLVEMN